MKNNILKHLSAMCCAVVLSLIVNVTANAYTLSLQTGNNSLGLQDPLVQVYGAAYADLVPSSGTSIQQAYVLTTPSYWVSNNIDALWVGVNPSSYGPQGAYQYLQYFDLPQLFTNVTISLKFRGDDIFFPQINGVNLVDHGFSGFSDINPQVLFSDITTLVQQGTNALSFVVINANLGDNPTGLQYTADINFDVPPAAPVPEPTTSVLLGVGVLCIVLVSRRRVTLFTK